MSHQIETIDNTSFFASALQPAWHKLGTVIDHQMDALEVLTEAHLAGWNVRKRPMTVQIDAVDELFTMREQISVPRYEAVVRDNPVTMGIDVLGVVGTQYRPFQNEELVDLLEAVVDETGANFETAGSLNGGRRVFVSMKLPNSMVLTNGDTDDQTNFYITIMNSHDGTSSLTMMTTPIRVVCANTLAWAFKENRGVVRIRHTENASFKIAEIRRDLNLSFGYIDEFQEEAQRLIDTHMDEEHIRKAVEDVFKLSEDDISKRVETTRQEHVDNVMNLYRYAHTLDGVRETAWGGLNAVTEYIDHHLDEKINDEKRASRSLFGGGSTLRQRAFATFA
ncbi:DUF932 domain-containing protein [Schaalia sp. lx-100]|uniref:DUF932 domain-containing protein n=1 Tax=Schaalia sp. lx-100 TaxID=2899081 RepID=UPI001E2D938E|nr:DUF932 domain-containing protein [Schaalia sp. lx-100]MCD4558235.1 DUF932 domain-containing protein [Schaalia sp. lx-100]